MASLFAHAPDHHRVRSRDSVQPQTALADGLVWSCFPGNRIGERMGSKLGPQGHFTRNPYRLPAVPGRLAHLANIRNPAKSGPLDGLAEGQDVIHCRHLNPAVTVRCAFYSVRSRTRKKSRITRSVASVGTTASSIPVIPACDRI